MEERASDSVSSGQLIPADIEGQPEEIKNALDRLGATGTRFEEV